jgi:Holliday junction resolvasome RuvABC DNA-binding subunit
MTNPITKIVNTKTGQEVIREMNEKEMTNWQQDKLDNEAMNQAETEKAEARLAAEAKLLSLGLTTEDLKALLG